MSEPLEMNNLSNETEEVRNWFFLCKQDFSEQWVAIAKKLNQQLFEAKEDDGIDIGGVIEEFREIFEHMTDDVSLSLSNQRNYCNALLNYCELTQDWRDWGVWIKEEIGRGVGEDGSWLFYGFGRYLEETGQLQKSLKYHQDGIEVSKRTGDKTFLAFNHLGAGITLQRSRKPKLAEQHLNQALKIFREQNDIYQQANTLANLASCYDRFGKSNLAISRYEESALLLRSIGNSFDLGRILYSLGIAYLRDNQLSQGEIAFIEGKKFCEKTKNNYFLALNLYGIGWFEYRRDNLEASRNYLEESIRKFKIAIDSGIEATQLSFPEIEGNIYLLAGAAYSKGLNPNFEAADKYLGQAEKAYRQLDYADTALAKVLANRARIYEYSKNWSAAIRLFYDLLAVGKRLRVLQITGDAAIHLVRIHRQKKSSIQEWIVITKRLGFWGILGLAMGCVSRVQRYLSLSFYLKKRDL